MIDHVSLGTTRYAVAVPFYQRVLAPLGIELLRNMGAEAAFGTPTQWSFFLYPVSAPEQVAARGTHVALGANSRTSFEGVYAEAIAASAKDISAPEERPEGSSTYFGAMFKDLDGHSVEVLTNAPAVHANKEFQHA